MNQPTSYSDVETWHADMVSSGRIVDNIVESTSTCDNDHVASSTDNALKLSNTTSNITKCNNVSRLSLVPLNFLILKIELERVLMICRTELLSKKPFIVR